MSRLPVLLAALVLAALPLAASAHATVSPPESVTDRIETYWLRVPTEGDSPTVEITLQIPAEVAVQRTMVKPGWTVSTVARSLPADASDEMKESPPLASITWKGGTVPAGQFDQFGFSGINPAKAATVSWNVHQQYADGKMTMWTGAPGSKTPASQTKILERPSLDARIEQTAATLSQLQQSYSQLNTGNAQNLQAASSASTPAYAALALAVVALVAAAVPLLRKKP